MTLHIREASSETGISQNKLRAAYKDRKIAGSYKGRDLMLDVASLHAYVGAQDANLGVKEPGGDVDVIDQKQDEEERPQAPDPIYQVLQRLDGIESALLQLAQVIIDTRQSSAPAATVRPAPDDPVAGAIENLRAYFARRDSWAVDCLAVKQVAGGAKVPTMPTDPEAIALSLHGALTLPAFSAALPEITGLIGDDIEQWNNQAKPNTVRSLIDSAARLHQQRLAGQPAPAVRPMHAAEQAAFDGPVEATENPLPLRTSHFIPAPGSGGNVVERYRMPDFGVGF